ncbi:MAG: cytochrome c biogenesis protein CcdA [Planctomycetota bacterium]|jgi:thiol:disulfide interchange protein DsbD
MFEQLLEESLQSGSILVYLFCFLAGVAASFTPCTYPVLPLTIGYIGNSSDGSKSKAAILSLVLVTGMALVYAVVGTISAAIGVQLGALWANGWVVYSIAIFFILMALMLLDVFTFPVPKFISNIQSKAGKRREGIFGAFLVGGVSGLVVGPCTGPILLSILLVVSTTIKEAQGAEIIYSALSGGAKLFVFGLGQGALIIISGVFAGFLTKLPKSGAWLVTVKKLFALLIIIGSSLLLVYAGQATDFPDLTRLLAATESTAPVKSDKHNDTEITGTAKPDDAENKTDESKFGGDDLLD